MFYFSGGCDLRFTVRDFVSTWRSVRLSLWGLGRRHRPVVLILDPGGLDMRSGSTGLFWPPLSATELFWRRRSRILQRQGPLGRTTGPTIPDPGRAVGWHALVTAGKGFPGASAAGRQPERPVPFRQLDHHLRLGSGTQADEGAQCSQPHTRRSILTPATTSAITTQLYNPNSSEQKRILSSRRRIVSTGRPRHLPGAATKLRRPIKIWSLEAPCSWREFMQTCGCKTRYWSKISSRIDPNIWGTANHVLGN